MATDSAIRETIFSYLAGLLSDEALEKWAYETVELEVFLGEEDYLDFVSATSDQMPGFMKPGRYFCVISIAPTL